MTNQQVRWGILGAARVNARLLPAIMAADNARLIAVASRRQGAAAALLDKLIPGQHTVQALDDPDLLIHHPEVEAIYLPMANEEHTEWALKAIEQGKHVLIEKPMALTVSDIEMIADAARHNKVKVMEGFMYLFHPQHAAVQEWVESGAIGTVRLVRTCFAFPMQPARRYRISRPIAKGGGAMWDIGPYAIHTARRWFDSPPQAVMAMAHLNEHGADLGMSGTLDFGDGRYAQFEISFEHMRRCEYEIIGTKGGIKCETVWNEPGDSPIVSWWSDSGERIELDLEPANHFVREIMHFSHCILSDTSPLLTLDDAKENCLVIQAALASASQEVQVRIFG